MRAETESPLEIFGRLNVKHGPNVEQLVREFDRSKGEAVVAAKVSKDVYEIAVKSLDAA